MSDESRPGANGRLLARGAQAALQDNRPVFDAAAGSVIPYCGFDLEPRWLGVSIRANGMERSGEKWMRKKFQ